jgi:NAD(P)-dependent dehydrogenase (short-subunit alcohol dehydrogenase family)
MSERSVIVTGAGGGIGRGIALACAAQAWFVGVATRGDNGKEVVEEIISLGGRATWLRCDVSRGEQVQAAVQSMLDATGGLDAFVHNATSGRSSQPHRLDDVSEDLFIDHAEVSLRGAYNAASFSRGPLSERGGSLILMTSPAGMEGSATLPLYATMKGALRGMAKSLAREWGPLGIRVNVVSPLGLSPAMERAITAEPAMEGRLARRVPLGRVGDPQLDVGPAVARLIGPDFRFVTGQTIGVDGGHFIAF